jgi:hypothetical protein
VTHPLYDLLSDLESAGIHFRVSRHRPDTILVTLTVVGERIEIDVFDDGRMEVSRFKGSEAVTAGSDLVKRIIAENRE